MTESLYTPAFHQETKDVTIIKGQAYRPQGVSFKLESIEAIVDLIETKGSEEATIIFYNDKGIEIVLDDTIKDRDKDYADYSFKDSDELKEWKGILNAPVRQKDLILFLQRQDPGVVNGIEDLLSKVQGLKIATQIVGDYQYGDDNNYTVMFKTSDGEGQVKLPKTITIDIPLVYGSSTKYSLVLEMQLNKPKEEKEKPTFTLTCPRLDRVIQVAKEDVIKELMKKLSGYLILAGSTGNRNSGWSSGSGNSRY